MSDIEILYNFYNNHFSSTIDTFENCSLDRINRLNLSHSKTKCFNFDKVKRIVFVNEDSCCSVDSLYFDLDKNILYFIEFKNASIKEAKKNVIRSSRESYIINRFLSTFAKIVDINNIKCHALLVTSEIKNNIYFSNENLIKLSGNNSKHPQLLSLESKLKNFSYFSENMFFDSVDIMSETAFDSQF